jgi:hypothetical protein
MRRSVLFIFFAALVLLPHTAQAAVTVSVNGSNHSIPQTNEKGWGANVTAWIQAISANTLQPSGGSFPLTAQVDFGANYGLKSPYYLSRALNPASAGQLRLGVADTVAWRNNANSGNLLLSVDASDKLTFNSIKIPEASEIVGLDTRLGTAEGTLSTTTSTLSTHVANMSNPHSVTKTQVGLSAVTNDAQLKIASNLSDLASASTARTNLGLGGAATLAVGTTTGTVAAGDDSRITGAAQKASNLSDLANATTARTNLGLGSSAVLAETSASFNANKLQGTTISASAPSSGQGLVYDGSNWSPGTVAAGGSLVSLLTNTGFESGLSSWVVAGGSGSTSTDRIEGTNAMLMTLTAVNGDIVSQSVTPSVSLAGSNLEYSAMVKTTLTNVQLCALQAGVEIQCALVPSTGVYQRTSFAIAAPSSGTIGLKLKSTSSATGTVRIDDAYVGIARNVSDFQAPVPIAIQKFTSSSGTYTPTIGTKWIRVKLVGGGGGGGGSASITAANGGTGGTGGNTTFGTLTANGGTGGTFSGGGSGGSTTLGTATGTAIPGSNGQNGSGIQNGGTSTANYLAGASGPTSPLGSYGAGGGGASGPNNAGAGSQSGGSGGAGGYVEVVVTTPASTTYTVGAAGTAGTAGTAGGAGNAGGSGLIIVEEFGVAQGQAYRPDQTAWKVDANIVGANAALGSAAVSSFTEITNGSLALTQNPGSLSTGIACATGTASAVGSTTCSAVNESAGVTFNVPQPGTVLACFDFTHYMITGAAQFSAGGATFELVETSASSSAIVQEGKSRTQDYHITVAATNSEVMYPQNVCGTFDFATAGQKTIRLMYEQAVAGGGLSGSTLQIDGSTSAGQRDLHVTVFPLMQNTPAPLLVGSVTSNSAGLERVERARVTCAASPSIAAQSGSWLTAIANSGNGNCQITIAAGIFSAVPHCVVTPYTDNTAANTIYSASTFNQSVTRLDIAVRYIQGNPSAAVVAPTSSTSDIICMGPR